MSFRLQLLLVGLTILAYLGARWWWLERQSGDDASQGVPNKPSQRIDPAMPDFIDLADTHLVDADSALPVAMADNRPTLDPHIDCIAMLDIDEPCTGEFALGFMPTTRRIGSKAWHVEGFNSITQAWEPVTTGRVYECFQAGIQLANRNGALSDMEFSEFVAKTSDLAQNLGASVDFPDMSAQIHRAKELEQFRLAHDICLSLNLHAKRAAWSFAYLQQHAHQAGFVPGVRPGRWVLGFSEHELIALTIDSQLAMADNVDAVPIYQMTLLLDVPQVARGDERFGKPFDVMCDVAIRLCAGMEAALVDEQGLAVDLKALQRTAAELVAIYDALDAAGLSAGSALAKRLFS